jgi:drug/metabolite transporter (DMT)-like permease
MIIPLWALLALVGAVLLAISNVIDKALLTRYLDDKEFIMSYSIRIIFILPILFFFKINFDFISILFFLFGIGYTIEIYFYAKAMRHDEVTRVTPIFSISPLLVMVFSAIFLKEIFTPIIYIGIILVVLGLLLLSYHWKQRHKFNKRSVITALAGATIYAIFVILIKHVISPELLPSLFFWIILGASSATFVLWFVEKERKLILKKLNRQSVTMIIGAQVLTLASYLANLGAITLGPVTLATTIYKTSPFFVLLFATLSAMFFRKYIHEDVCRFTIIQKIIAIGMILAGIALIT